MAMVSVNTFTTPPQIRQLTVTCLYLPPNVAFGAHSTSVTTPESHFFGHDAPNRLLASDSLITKVAFVTTSFPTIKRGSTIVFSRVEGGRSEKSF
jgi:hypothetical protein